MFRGFFSAFFPAPTHHILVYLGQTTYMTKVELKHASGPYFTRIPLRSLKVLIYVISCAAVTSWKSKLKHFAKVKVVTEF